jgi:DNA polymerase III alpha subunit
MKLDSYGQTIVDINDVFNALYNGTAKDLSGVYFENIKDVRKFNQAVEANADNISKINLYQAPTVSIEEFDLQNQKQWFMPIEYRNMDIEKFLVDQCPDQNYDRLIKELELFRQHNMISLLKYLKYLVDFMRKHNIVWGVGRGSSIASYCLYLLGIHKVDSIKYNLDIHEFLK